MPLSDLLFEMMFCFVLVCAMIFSKWPPIPIFVRDADHSVTTAIFLFLPLLRSCGPCGQTIRKKAARSGLANEVAHQDNRSVLSSNIFQGIDRTFMIA